MNALEWLSRLLPARVQKRPPLANAERLKLLGGVGDADNCLRAVLDQQMELLAAEFSVAIDPARPDLERLRACEGMRMAYYSLEKLESERAVARRQRREAEEQQSQG